MKPDFEKIQSYMKGAAGDPSDPVAVVKYLEEYLYLFAELSVCCASMHGEIGRAHV